MAKLAYDYTNQELVDAFWKAVARAGVSGSGLVIDVMAGHDREEAYYLYGVLLSRLEGKKRPFTRGDHVRMNSSATYRCGSVNSVGEYYSRGEAKSDKTYEVVRTFYEKDGKWALCFREDDGYRYPADRFEKLEKKQSATA